MNDLINTFASHSTSLVVIVTVIYALVGIANFVKGNFGFGVMWCAYSVANIGLILAEKGI